MGEALYLVVGLGKTGHATARYLQRRGKRFATYDTRTQPTGLAEYKTEFPNTELFLGNIPKEKYAEFHEIITSPGVPLDDPSLTLARQKGIPIVGDIECFAREVSVPVIAITGTNGKSTVTTLVGEMAKALNLKVAVAGNIGLPVLDLLDDGIQYDLWVVELSSFQLEMTFSLKPAAATILNISPDHLDRHHTLDAYIKAKQRIYHQAKNMIYNREDSATKPTIDNEVGKKISFGLNKPAIGEWGLLSHQDQFYLVRGSELFLSVEELKLKGRHNWQNVLAACALIDAAGYWQEGPIIKVLKEFAGLPHRSQWVRHLEGVDWINDSKGTNIGATIAAISGIGDAMQGKIVLIAGGQGKGADFSELRDVVANYVRTVVLIGEDAEKLDEAFSDVVEVKHASSLESAVNLARAQAKPGDVVLLSPACASLDMFRDFNHRGECFTTVVEAL